MAQTAVVYSGREFSIEYAVCLNEAMPARDFIEGQLNEREQRQLMALFTRLGDIGEIRNPQQFKKLEGKLWEFKRHQIRVACFQQGHRWILASAFRKKRDNWPRQEIERAQRIMQEHLARGAAPQGGWQP